MPRSRLKVEGIEDAIRRVDDVGERARKPEPALRHSEDTMRESQRRVFLTGRFKRDTPEWVDRKRRLGASTRTMQFTGRLRDALEGGDRTEGVRFSVFNAELRWGLTSTSELGRVALAQARAGRRVVRIDVPAKREITERVQDFIANGFDSMVGL